MGLYSEVWVRGGDVVMVPSLSIQSKDDYQKVVVKLTEDLQQRDLCVTEYKRVSDNGGSGKEGNQ